MTRLFKIAAVVIMLFLGLNLGTDLTFAADLPVVSGHSKVDAEMRLEEFAKGTHASCTAWTDGCRTCGRNPDGVFCSNVGIACQVSKPRCTRP
jgi:hypothetical protein